MLTIISDYFNMIYYLLYFLITFGIVVGPFVALIIFQCILHGHYEKKYYRNTAISDTKVCRLHNVTGILSAYIYILLFGITAGIVIPYLLQSNKRQTDHFIAAFVSPLVRVTMAITNLYVTIYLIIELWCFCSRKLQHYMASPEVFLTEKNQTRNNQLSEKKNPREKKKIKPNQCS